MIVIDELRGTGVAVVTPFMDDGRVDFSALKYNVDYLIKGGVNYLVVLGTTAETVTLSEQEQLDVAECVYEKNAGRVPLVIGAGGNNTLQIIDKLEGNLIYEKYDALLIATPHYNKPNQEGLFQHYNAIAEATEKSIILYNVPSRTGVNMTAETSLRLANTHKHIIAIKEASGNLIQISHIVKEKPAHFEVISGDDGLTLAMLAIGAVGVISVLANALPRQVSEMVNAALIYDYKKAKELHNRLFDLSQSIFAEGNPAGVKALMAEQGLLCNNLRLPLVKVSEELKGLLKQQFLEVKL